MVKSLALLSISFAGSAFFFYIYRVLMDIYDNLVSWRSFQHHKNTCQLVGKYHCRLLLLHMSKSVKIDIYGRFCNFLQASRVLLSVSVLEVTFFPVLPISAEFCKNRFSVACVSSQWVFLNLRVQMLPAFNRLFLHFCIKLGHFFKGISCGRGIPKTG